MSLKGVLQYNNYLSLFLILLGLFLLSEILFQTIGILLIYPLHPQLGLKGITELLTDPSAQDLQDRWVLFSIKLVLLCVSLGKFILSPLLFVYMINRPELFDFGWNKHIRIPSAIVIILIILSVGPLTNWTYQLNRSIAFPEILKGVEGVLVEMEESAEKLTKAFLMTPHILDFVTNVVLIGMLAAFGEEFFFRGILLRLFRAWTKNLHASVWIAAFVFSFIHYQFYGFFPRMLLGGLLGYLFVWSGSLWAPIFAHFVNNMILVCYYFFLELGWVNTVETEIRDIYVLLSLIPLSGLLYYYYIVNRKKSPDGEKLGQSIHDQRRVQSSHSKEPFGE